MIAHTSTVMAGLVPAIHARTLQRTLASAADTHPLIRPSFAIPRGVDARDKPGHDELKRARPAIQGVGA